MVRRLWLPLLFCSRFTGVFHGMLNRTISLTLSYFTSYQPAPFFVLDEVDAALDNTNVAKIANYIRAQASDSFQFIVISLKGSLYERGNSLVGIYRDQDVNSSRTLTLDVSFTACKGLTTILILLLQLTQYDE